MILTRARTPPKFTRRIARSLLARAADKGKSLVVDPLARPRRLQRRAVLSSPKQGCVADSRSDAPVPSLGNLPILGTRNISHSRAGKTFLAVMLNARVKCEFEENK
jgi:hypothetical protein